MKTLTYILHHTDHKTKCNWCKAKAKYVLTYSETINKNRLGMGDTVNQYIYACEKCKDEKRIDKKLNMEDDDI